MRPISLHERAFGILKEIDDLSLVAGEGVCKGGWVAVDKGWAGAAEVGAGRVDSLIWTEVGGLRGR